MIGNLEFFHFKMTLCNFICLGLYTHYVDKHMAAEVRIQMLKKISDDICDQLWPVQRSVRLRGAGTGKDLGQPFSSHILEKQLHDRLRPRNYTK